MHKNIYEIILISENDRSPCSLPDVLGSEHNSHPFYSETLWLTSFNVLRQLISSLNWAPNKPQECLKSNDRDNINIPRPPLFKHEASQSFL